MNFVLASYKMNEYVTPIKITELEKTDLSFLFALWRMPEVMRYADEFPRMRGWSKSDDPVFAWTQYVQKRSKLGNLYTQWILRQEDATPIGESFFAPLADDETFGKWKKPKGVVTVLGDIKLAPHYWGQGLGTEAMRKVVQHIFTDTTCELCCVPPHRQNPAAYRVYEKAGFKLFTGMRSYRNHQLMELTREGYEELNRKQPL
jgi:RimJ/RimL family protein N-acetyltransferase